METLDFDHHFRRMEHADDQQLTILQQQLTDYLRGSADEPDELTLAARRSDWKQALARLRERSANELSLVKELIGVQQTV